MANFDTIKTVIDANINTNGKQTITGAVMNSVLKQMVDSIAIPLNGYIPDIQNYSYTANNPSSTAQIDKVVIENLKGKITYKVVATSDIYCYAIDNGSYFKIFYNPHGEYKGFNNVFVDLYGSQSDKPIYTTGQIIKEGTIEFDTPQDIGVRHKMVGSFRLEYTVGEEKKGVVEQVDENTSAIDNLKPQVLQNSTDIADIISKLPKEAVYKVVDYTSTRGQDSQVVKVLVAGIPAFTTIKVKLEATSQLTYTKSSTGSTFVGAAIQMYVDDSNVGSQLVNNNIVGNQLQQTISAGTTILEYEYTTDEKCSIVVRGYFNGSVRLTTSYSEMADPIETYKYQLNKALQLGYVSADWGGSYSPMPLVFMHISDTHGQINNVRAIQLLNYLGEGKRVQFLMHTGDILRDPNGTYQSVWSSIVAEAKYPVMIASGNHDVGNWSTDANKNTSDADFYNYFIAPQLNQWGLKSDGGGNCHPSGKNYYFKDFTSEKIRFIVPYEFEIPQTTKRGARWISQAQADWFVDALRTTPNGYGVIVAKHMPDNFRGYDDNPFNSPLLRGDTHTQAYVSRDFFAEIIDAFMTKSTFDKSYINAADGLSTTIVVNADFTQVNAEFICHVTGHTHADGISFLKDFPNQLELNINCSNNHYEHYSNLDLEHVDSYKDALNVYSIDRKNGLIHVVRIGGEYSADGDRRDILTIDYRNKKYIGRDGNNERIDEISKELEKKQDALISGKNIKTINGQSLLGEGNIVIEGGAGNSYDDTEIRKEIVELSEEINEISEKIENINPAPMVLVTYAELVELRDNGELIAGMQYRITDYVTTTAQENTRSAGHQFDVIVTADSATTLNEVARACVSEGDTYFTEANANLAAWQIWYSLDNDTARFAWADAENGKGVIYRMIDEWGNDVPYDFKNIQYERNLIFDSGYAEFTNFNIGKKWVYTFAGQSYHVNNDEWSDMLDGSLESPFGHLSDENTSTFHDNTIKPYIIVYNGNDVYTECGIRYLNDMVFLGYWEKIGSANEEDVPYYYAYCCYSNSFGNNCYSNSFGNSCHNNSLGHSCGNNSFGNNCGNNSLGNNCYSNSFSDGCGNNSLGHSCGNNSFSDGCGNNSLGHSCGNNSFSDGCRLNSLIGECYDVKLSKNTTYQIVSYDSNGEVKVFNLADLADLVG